MSCKLKKNTRSPNSPLFLLIVWWLPMFDFGIFWHLPRLMGIYRVSAPVWVFEKFCSVSLFFSFLPFLFFFSLFFFFFWSLSLGGPFSSGTHRHCPPMLPSCYATEGGELCKIKKTNKQTKKQKQKQTKTKNKNKNKKIWFTLPEVTRYRIDCEMS